MHPELIKAELRIKGSSLAAVARETGVTLKNVSHVVRDRHRSLRIARRICEVTGLSPDTAWPGRYPEFRFNPVRFSDSQIKEVA